MAANLSHVGLRIKHLREEAGLTQKQIADFLSVDQSLISKFEKGERSLSSDLLHQLSALFCCPVSSFLKEDAVLPAYTIAFRTTAMDTEDLCALTAINRIALNQFQMDQLQGGTAHD